MTKKEKIVLWVASLAALVAILTALAFYFSQRKPLWLKGVIVVQSADPRKRVPIANVDITVNSGAGAFTISAPLVLGADQTWTNGSANTITVSGGVTGTASLVMNANSTGGIQGPFFNGKTGSTAPNRNVSMVPLVESVLPPVNRPTTMVANLRVRYSIKATTAVNIGSTVKTFQVQNTGNVPCKNQNPCSPDGLWKAAIGSISLDAGAGNEFRNARVSCIAGPCPFTKIEKDGLSRAGQKISASVRVWSDTATFLLEAEVFHPMVTDIVHESHPVIFGRALNFTLPATAEGVCIQADVASETVIFPLGPALFLSWANCEATVGRDQTKVYRCELKPEYQFPGTSTEQDQGTSQDESSRERNTITLE